MAQRGMRSPGGLPTRGPGPCHRGSPRRAPAGLNDECEVDFVSQRRARAPKARRLRGRLWGTLPLRGMGQACPVHLAPKLNTTRGCGHRLRCRRGRRSPQLGPSLSRGLPCTGGSSRPRTRVSTSPPARGWVITAVETRPRDRVSATDCPPWPLLVTPIYPGLQALSWLLSPGCLLPPTAQGLSPASNSGDVGWAGLSRRGCSSGGMEGAAP